MFLIQLRSEQEYRNDQNKDPAVCEGKIGGMSWLKINMKGKGVDVSILVLQLDLICFYIIFASDYLLTKSKNEKKSIIWLLISI